MRKTKPRAKSVSEKIHSRAKGKPAVMSSTESRKRREAAIARLRELQCGEKDGTLIKRDAAQRAWSEIVCRIRDRMLGLPGKVAPQLANRKLPEIEIRNLLRAEVESLLTGMADAQL